MKQIVYSYKTRPQRLCKQCGLCCTMAVCQYSQDELKTFSEDKESEASDFLSVFVPYPNLVEPEKLSKKYVETIVNKLKETEQYKENEPIFLRCKHILPDNTCSVYEKRFGWCKRTPRHAWTIMPDSCGFKGWQFGLREQIKHNVRELKEILYKYEIIYGNDGFIPSQNMSVSDFKKMIYKRITPYERFGSMYW